MDELATSPPHARYGRGLPRLGNDCDSSGVFTHAHTTAEECGFDTTVAAAEQLLIANTEPNGPHLGIAARYKTPEPAQHTRAKLVTYDEFLASFTTPEHAEAS